MTETHFMLSSATGEESPVLQSVQASGRIDDVLFELTLRQTYRNTGPRPIEAIYTFPLPLQATLLGFAAELNGARRVGTMVEKRQAEATYEQALETGDAPVMLEAGGLGLHTANIGNLKPGDEIVLEVRFVQCLAFEQGRLRLVLPTAVAPRYGDPAATGLQAQQVPVVDIDAEYPLSLALRIGHSLAGADVQCATHAFDLAPHDDGSRQLTLRPGARLDRDVVLLLVPREVRPSLIARARDERAPEAPVVLMAALQLPRQVSDRPVAIKLLVDCSGSMAGDSMQSARTALHSIADALDESDELGLTRFGSHPVWELSLGIVGDEQRDLLRRAIDRLEADLGGTELREALCAATTSIPGRSGGDVLLITDGQVWEGEALAKLTSQRQHRIFAIGVGSAPAEGQLRMLAEQTGGACEFATPGEDLAAAAQRMLRRMRQPAHWRPRIDWGGVHPAWAVPLPAGLFAGDSVMALAGFAEGIAPRTAVRLLADDEAGNTVELARCEAEAGCDGDALPRLAAAARLKTSVNDQARALAVSYQLMSSYTHCVLVHERTQDERVTEPAAVRQVASMLAAGWGGTGMVKAACAPMTEGVKHFFDPSTRFGEDRSVAYLSAPDRPGFGLEGCDLPAAFAAPVRAAAGAAAAPGRSASALPLSTVLRHIQVFLRKSGGVPTGLAAHLASLQPGSELQDAVAALQQQGLDADQGWLLVALWSVARWPAPAPDWLQAAVQPFSDRPWLLDDLRRRLGDPASAHWQLSRAERLRQAVGLGG